MSSTTLSVCPHPPPTTNLLNSQQRTRLMRSTRKVGALLGTTPYLLENDMSFAILPLGKTTSKALKRQGSIFTHKQPSSLSVTSISTTSSHNHSHSTSSLSYPRSTAPGVHPTNPPGLSTTQKRRPRDKPPQLHLQLNTSPLSSINDCFASSLSLSPPPSPCPSPVTPTTPDPTEIRRKRMAKLARHLGERIPVELVIDSKSAPKRTASPDRHPERHTQSVHVLHDDVAHICGNMPPRDQLRSRQEWVGEWNRSNICDVQKELRNLKVR